MIEINGRFLNRNDIPRIGEITGAHRTTVARWFDKGEFPPAVGALLAIVYGGDLGAIHDAWAGFSINPHTGALFSPDGRPTDPGEVLAIYWRYQQIRELTAEVRQLRQAAGADPEQLTDDALAREFGPNVIRFPQAG